MTSSGLSIGSARQPSRRPGATSTIWRLSSANARNQYRRSPLSSSGRRTLYYKNQNQTHAELLPVRRECSFHIRLPHLLVDDPLAALTDVDLIYHAASPLQLKLPVPVMMFAV